MTPARLDSLIASLRANGSSAPVSPHDLVTGFLLLADIRDAERALRKAGAAYDDALAKLDPESLSPMYDTAASGPLWQAVKAADARLRALGVDP